MSLAMQMRGVLRFGPMSRLYSTGGSFETLLVSKAAPGVRLVQLNRPKQLNALNTQLIDELNQTLKQAGEDDEIRAVVLTGSEKAFAAGADIKEMSSLEYGEVARRDFIESWSLISKFKKPLIGAVNGYALGGGCELAMMCDVLYAGEGATFGQPEIKLGVIPGAGGTQRLTRAIGKSNAMELVLTGRNFSAQEALAWNLVSRIYPKDSLVAEAVKTAQTIAEFSPLAVKAGKECVNESQELSLESGLRAERRSFHGLFGSKDKQEGMAAFVEKRKPQFTGD